MSSAEGPKASAFKYVLIPAKDSEDIQECFFDGASDEEFRTRIRSYFQEGGMTEGQKADYRKTLEEKSKEHGATTAAAIDNIVEESTFEIVPLVLPTVRNRFVGTSLYIDDIGRFKDRPLNYRASHIAQRDIRGDAFMCSNYDDPADEDWRRVDCTVEHYNALKANPVQAALDTSSQGQMQAAGMMRDAQSIVVPPEDAAEALAAKAEGNAKFGRGDIAGALEEYNRAIELTNARRDKLENRAEVEAMRVTAFSNRALCHLKTGAFKAAEADCRAVLAIPELSSQPKVLYRLAQALDGQVDYDGALQALQLCESAGGPPEDVAQLRSHIESKRAALVASQKAKYSKMFS